MIKGPALVCLNLRTGTARRYVRRKNWAVAGTGWELAVTHTAKIDPAAGFDGAAMENYRITGVGSD